MIKSKQENEVDIEKFEVEQTMTLKEITDLLEVRHNNAMAVVSKMLENQEFGHATKIQYRTTQGNEYETYQLNKRQSIAVAAKLNTSLLMRIIDRWQELENRPNTSQLPDFTNPAESARAWAEQFEKREIAEQKNIQLKHKIEEDKEKVGLAEALLNLGEKDGRVKLKVFAKCVEDVYGVGRNSLYQTLEDMKIWGKDRVPFARFIQNGMFSVKLESWNNSKTGCQGTNTIVHINPKGMQYLIKKLSALLDTDDI